LRKLTSFFHTLVEDNQSAAEALKSHLAVKNIPGTASRHSRNFSIHSIGSAHHGLRIQDTYNLILRNKAGRLDDARNS